MDKMTEEYLEKSILEGKFEVAKKIITNLSEKNQLDILINLAYKTESLSFYTIILDMLLSNETVHWHRVAICMLTVPFSHIVGSDSFGLYHARRAVKLDPKDIGLRQLVLSYYKDAPEPLLSEKEAVKVAREIIALDPENPGALEVLQEHG